MEVEKEITQIRQIQIINEESKWAKMILDALNRIKQKQENDDE